MARLLRRGPVALSLFFLSLVRGSEVIVGDAFTFQDTSHCKAAEGELIHRDRNQRVAFHTEGVWKPDDYYKDRVHSNSSVSFARTVFTDSGTYELICDHSQAKFIVIQLKVVAPHYASVSEGDAVKLQCFYDTKASAVESVGWMKHGELVFERNFSSSGVRRGAGHEGRVSMSREASGDGDLSVDVAAAHAEDAGDYFCYVRTKERGENEFVGAVRLTVNGKTLNKTKPTQICPEDKSLGSGTIIGLIFGFLTVAILFTLLGWCLTSHT
ncbi:uncharacterized protein LOC114866322 isoform X2 [Betta splendens]|uniref:Uncharacterized protein LOC114866322 isoform X2 n=1 Tax=Betta splendens TaxID=158456 RepID=A0A6P7P112_BETSP|nr:uncharacterized protein LOC114866322 isoform X2 [Betta splendens]